MKIHIQLGAFLRDKLPAGSTGGKADLDFDDQATVNTVLDRLGIATDHAHLVMVNGEMERDPGRVLNDGDELAVFPPVAGG